LKAAVASDLWKRSLAFSNVSDMHENEHSSNAGSFRYWRVRMSISPDSLAGGQFAMIYSAEHHIHK
jgi:hypothetical protein